MGLGFNHRDVRHFVFDFGHVTDEWTLNDSIKEGLHYPGYSKIDWRHLHEHLVYQECVYHYWFRRWPVYAGRLPRKSKRFLRIFTEYRDRHAHAFFLHLE